MSKDTLFKDKNRLCGVCFQEFSPLALHRIKSNNICINCLKLINNRGEAILNQSYPDEKLPPNLSRFLASEKTEIITSVKNYVSNRNVLTTFFNLVRFTLLVAMMFLIDASGEFRGYIQGILIADFLSLAVFRLIAYVEFPIIGSLIFIGTIIYYIKNINDLESALLIMGFIFTVPFKVAYYRFVYFWRKHKIANF